MSLGVSLMAHTILLPEPFRLRCCPWRVGTVLDSPELLDEIEKVTAETGATCPISFRASAATLDIASAVEREKLDILFVEFARASKPAQEWIGDVRRGARKPLVVAVHPVPGPSEIISALRAGADEFLSLPLRPAIYEAMERLGSLLESMRTSSAERGRIAGILSAKGGCGATSFACYLSAALESVKYPRRVLVADLDSQAPAAQDVFCASPDLDVRKAFEAVRGINSAVWKDFVVPAGPNTDFLRAPAFDASLKGHAALPEVWRVESLFGFVRTLYGTVLADLGRHLNPSNWIYLQNVDELFLVTAPDVLALYQTRSILQTLSGRGFDKSRVRLILNRNLASPQDFWVESIEQMFELSVFGVVPHEPTLDRKRRQTFEFPADSAYGRALLKIAGRFTTPAEPETRGFRLRKKAA